MDCTGSVPAEELANKWEQRPFDVLHGAWPFGATVCKKMDQHDRSWTQYNPMQRPSPRREGGTKIKGEPTSDILPQLSLQHSPLKCRVR